MNDDNKDKKQQWVNPYLHGSSSSVDITPPSSSETWHPTVYHPSAKYTQYDYESDPDDAFTKKGDYAATWERMLNQQGQGTTGYYKYFKPERKFDTISFKNGAGLHLSEAPYLQFRGLTNLEYIEENHITTVFVLLTRSELQTEYGSAEKYFNIYKKERVKVYHYPILDFSVPTSLRSFANLINLIIVLLKKKQHVLIHCMGGHGRTGLVATGVLVKTGKTAEEALTYVRKIRKAVETKEQEKFLKTYEWYLTLSKEDLPPPAFK